ncbi:MAG: Holliday junction branch migration protein RuvA [Archangium sp.]|nr:Holliday junction branch migration protein RuvA [Archangium sp.]
MIAALRGVVAEKSASDAVIDVQGVGYRVSLSLLSMAKLPETGAEVALRIRTVVREDAFDLYGFLSRQEEDVFLLLTSVSHVGPKMALTVLSGLEVDDLVGCIAKGDVARLTKVHGVGKKTAERLVLELKDKMKLLSVGAASSTAPSTSSKVPPARSDLVSALVNLGYKPPQAEHAAHVVAERVPEEAAFEVQFREALKVLRAGH